MVKRIAFLLCLLCLYFQHKINAQIDTIFYNGQPSEDFEIKRIQQYYIETGNEKNLEEILLRAKFENFDWLKRNRYRHRNLWLRFTIKNKHITDPTKLNAYFGKQDTNPFYYQLNNGNIKLQKIGTVKSFLPINVPPNSYCTYWVFIEEYIYFDFIEGYLFTQKKVEKLRTSSSYFLKTKQFAFICMVLGLFFFTGLIATFQSMYTKDRTHGYWAMYLFINALFFASELNRAFGFDFLQITKYNETNISLPWPTAIQFLVSIFYLLFIGSFLEIKHHNPQIYRFINLAIKIMLVCFVFALFAVIVYDLGLTIYADMLLVVTNLLILATVIMIIRSNIPQKNLLMIGTFGVLISASISILMEIVKTETEFWTVPIIIFAIGCLWEMSCFALALSQRTKRMQYEAQQIQKNYTIKLENELSERLEVIHIKDKQLEEQRINTLTSEFEQKIAETEITALRSQMNPHFIFNCLNSIKLYSLENDSESASIYLTKFSKLIRLVLDNSRSERLTLEKEIETLRLYIEMEIMRFKEKVQYELIVSPEIDQQYVEIPPLLIQPFVENAIWHGLMHKEFGGKVSILLHLVGENMLEIQIIDNGVGREKSAEYKSKTATKHKSFGMKVTNERIDLINQIYKTNANVEIEDLYDQNQNGIGTKVTIQIPI